MVKPGWLLVPNDDDLCPTFCRDLRELGIYIARANDDNVRGGDVRCGFTVRHAAIYESDEKELDAALARCRERNRERGMRGVDDATA